MKNTFIIPQSLTFGEFYGCFLFNMSRMRLVQAVVILPFSFTVFINIIMYALSPGRGIDPVSLFLPLLAIPIVIVLFILTGGLLLSILLLVFKPNLWKNSTYEFTHWGMLKKGIGIDYSRQWSQFLKYTETKNFIHLFISQSESHPIQKKMFSSIDELEQFRTFIGERLPAK